MIKLSLIGNIGGDATVRTLDNGSTAISFSVAVTEKRKDQEITTWAACTIWKYNDQPTTIAQYLKKGQKVYVEGKPSVRTYVTREAQTGASLEVRVDIIELIGGGTQTAPQQAPQSAPVAQPRPQAVSQPASQASPFFADDNDLPF